MASHAYGTGAAPSSGSTAGAGSSNSQPARRLTASVRLLTVNDVYTLRDIGGVGGYATLRTMVKAHQKPHSVFVINGDVLGGSQLCESFRGEPAVAVLNAVRPDIATVGNHEFDYGEDRLEQLMQDSQFPWLGNNIRRRSQGGRLMRGVTPYVMYDFTVDSTGAVVARTQVEDQQLCAALVGRPDFDTEDGYPAVSAATLTAQRSATAAARAAGGADAGTGAAAAGAIAAASALAAAAPAVLGASAPAIAGATSTPAVAGAAGVRVAAVCPAGAPTVTGAAVEAAGEDEEEEEALLSSLYLSTPSNRALFNPPLLRALSSSHRAAQAFTAAGGEMPAELFPTTNENTAQQQQQHHHHHHLQPEPSPVGSVSLSVAASTVAAGAASPASAAATAAASAAGTGPSTAAPSPVPSPAFATASATNAATGISTGADATDAAASTCGVAPFFTFRVGFLGACTVHTPKQSYPSADVIFDDAVETCARTVGALRNVGHCDVVVALTHLALHEDVQVIEAVPGIDLILGGHEHTPIIQQQDTRLIFKTGQNANYLGVVDLHVTFPLPEEPVLAEAARKSHEAAAAAASVAAFSPPPVAAAAATAGFTVSTAAVVGPAATALRVETDVSVLPSFQLIANINYKPDKDTESVITVYEAKLEELISRGPDPSRVVATLSFSGPPLETRTNSTRCRSASGPHLVADAMLAFHREYADAACINGGFVRGDTIYPPGHPLQYRELMAELPFPKCTTVLRITGAAWREAIEQQLMLAPKPAGSFPHYSKNVSITYNPQRTVGARVLSFSVNGEPVDPDREYVVVTSNFIAAGGDGVAAFTKGTVLPQGDKDTVQILGVTTQYLDAQGGTYTADAEDRILAVDE